MNHAIPVITLDGPGGAGKGTLGRRLARRLGFHFLDSGLLYRGLAVVGQIRAERLGRPLTESEIIIQAKELVLHFTVDESGKGPAVIWEHHDISRLMKQETIGNQASQYGAIPQVRAALWDRQRAFLQAPGLVADGRDMGTVIFPEAELKFFITASVQERAQRRMKELQAGGIHANLAALSEEIEARDRRDRQRAIAPLIPAQEAYQVDTTGLNVDEVFEQVWNIVSQRLPTVKGG